MFSLQELSQLTVSPMQSKPEKNLKVVGVVKRRESTWNRFYEQHDEIQKALKKDTVWKVAVRFGFCHKTLQKYLNDVSLENNSQVN